MVLNRCLVRIRCARARENKFSIKIQTFVDVYKSLGQIKILVFLHPPCMYTDLNQSQFLCQIGRLLSMLRRLVRTRCASVCENIFF